MNKNKNKFFIIFILLFSLIYSSLSYSNNRSNIKNDIPIIREYIFDLLSLSRVDINNYSVNANFEKEYSSKSTQDIWNNSITYNYIDKNKDKKYQSKKSMTLSNKITDIIEEIHIKNIEFLKNNLIPLENLEGDKSDEELEKYISNVNKNKEELLKKTSLLEEKIKTEIYQYIKYLNRYGNKLSIEEEEERFNEYFKKEYEEILSKQINLKIEELLK